MPKDAPFTYTGENLREIAFPLGGIGTGCLSIEGRGALRDWEIFGRPNKNTILDWTFAALWCKPEGGEGRARVVQGRRMKDFAGDSTGNFGMGTWFHQGDGMPCFEHASFKGTFPFARIELSDPACPLVVTIEAFSPFIPMDARSSSFPVASLTYRLHNPGTAPVDAVLAMNLCNPIGFGVAENPLAPNKATCSARSGNGFRGLDYSNERFAANDAHVGTVSLTTDWSETSFTERWHHSGWFDGLQRFWTTFSADGSLPETDPRPPADRLPGSLGLRVRLEPGETQDLRFLISWVFPNAERDWARDFEPKAKPWRRWYATQWPTAWDAASEFWSRRDELTSRTSAFEDALHCTTLPPDVVESIATTASILRSPTCDRLEDGTFWAWEGCGEKSGCCHGSCSHVWNYALTHAYLFPELQRSMRETDYNVNFRCGPQGEKGGLEFRVMIPLGSETCCENPASDGQLGVVMQVCRDWKLSGDDSWLTMMWPSAQRALEYAWVRWDTDRDGLVDGDQHNTYDINFQGGNPLTQFMYLGALRAGEEMARHLGQTEKADEYRKLYESGRSLTEQKLWNGEFFVQTYDCLKPDAPKYQHGVGCLSDQVFGQWCAHVAGLGDLVDPALVRNALEAVVRHNLKDPLGDHANLQRIYAFRDETGLILCSWPNGGRPAIPFPYSDEVWTGIEYQFASHLAHDGLVDDALRIVSAIRNRHDGRRRNPYNEFECGSHYSRALASYGLLLAFTGFVWDGHTRTATAKPRWSAEEPFRSFFCTPHGWGTFTMDAGRPVLNWVEGGASAVG